MAPATLERSSTASEAAASPYLLKEMKGEKEMADIIGVVWAANHDPYDGIAQVFFPQLGYQPSDREAALSEATQRFWDGHLSDPSSNWIYVVEQETGKVVGCAQWQTLDRNPFPDGPPSLSAPWWPCPDRREFAETILNQIYKCRSNWMTRPHFGMFFRHLSTLDLLLLSNAYHTALNWMAVDPKYRRQGIASRIMQWGIERADEEGAEAWLEGSTLGRLVYEKFGFRSLFRLDFDAHKLDSSEEWRRAEFEMKPPPYHAMWRPPRGRWEGAKMPWQLGVLDTKSAKRPENISQEQKS